MHLSPNLVAPPVYYLYRLWCSSLRYREINRAGLDVPFSEGSCVGCLWHDELFALMHLRRQVKVMALVSQSGDGEFLAQVLERLGIAAARGSSSRGGVKALLVAAKKMQEEPLCACVTVDGPRGPRHKAKEGALFLARKANAPIVPMRLYMEKAKIFTSWDNFQLPYPFSRVTVVYGDPYRVQADLRDAEAMEHERQKLETCLENLTP